MNNVMKKISLMGLGGVAWMVCAIAMPMNQAQDTQSLTAKVADLVISQAYADDEAKNDDSESKDDESKDKESKDSSISYDFSSATLVCVSRSTVLTTLNFTSSESEAKSDDDGSKSDDEAKSDDDSSTESSEVSLDDESSEVDSSDDESKSDDEGKSDDSEDKSKDDSSTAVTQSYIEALPACTVFGSTVAGVYVPSTAIISSGSSASSTTGTTSGSSTSTGSSSVSLDSNVTSAYFAQLASGTSGLSGAPKASKMESYREIHGE